MPGARGCGLADERQALREEELVLPIGFDADHRGIGREALELAFDPTLANTIGSAR